MSFFGNIFGGFSNLIGGKESGGQNFRGTAAPILQPTDLSQVSNAYGQAQSGLGQQQSFLNALQGVSGINNQQSVFNQQQGLANQFQDVANGVGPNAALAQLNQSTGQNVANQAALMAGQRGASSNAGLLARQIGQQGAGIQQQAVGQGATLQAQQQLAAMNALQGQQANMANLAGNQIAQQQQGLGNYNQMAQNEQGQLLGALQNYNSQGINMQENLNNVNAGIAGATIPGQQKLQGSAISGIGQAFGLAGFGLAQGGMVKNYASGGTVNPVDMSGPQSFVGKYFSNPTESLPDQSQPRPMGAPQDVGQNDALSKAGKGIGSGFGSAIKGILPSFGGSSSGLISTAGAGDLMEAAPLAVAAVSKGGAINGEMLASKGKEVPGKAKVKGDSLKNDVVPAMLSPGEVVIPRHIMQSGDPVNNAAKFVQAVLAKQGMRRG